MSGGLDTGREEDFMSIPELSEALSPPSAYLTKRQDLDWQYATGYLTADGYATKVRELAQRMGV